MPTQQQYSESIRVNQNCFVPVAKISVLICGFLTVLVALINFFHSSLNTWCSGSSSQTCIGPALKWNSGSVAFTEDSNKEGWRSVITTDVNTVLDVFSPMIFGLLILATASSKTRDTSSFVAGFAYSWSRMGFLLIFTALFGSIGYAGNFGIVTGVINLTVSGYLFFMAMVPALSGNAYPCSNTNPNHSR